MLFDSHCHLTDEQFAPDLADVLRRAAESGVTRLVTICSDAADARAAARIAGAHDGVWCTAGIHPHQAANARRADLDAVAELLEGDKIVAVGETGLDYYYDNAPRNVQRKLLTQHMQMAADLGLPVVVHSRDADEDTIGMIRSVEGEVLGVLHCFAAGPDLLEAGLEAGWMISFSGLITFKKYEGQDLIRAVPPDQILVETDSPYLAPIPNRGKRNEPAFVRAVASELAHVRGVDLETISAQTTANALRFYGLRAEAATIAQPESAT